MSRPQSGVRNQESGVRMEDANSETGMPQPAGCQQTRKD